MVDLLSPLKVTTELGIKLLPFTVMVKPLLPTGIELGEILLMLGLRLELTTINAWALEVPLEGFVTVMPKEPRPITSAALIAAVSWVGET